jgi:hypothetical protein
MHEFNNCGGGCVSRKAVKAGKAAMGSGQQAGK